jgi:acyl CoA:acetate/3-ketoacid CoA transferase beta subunit
LSAELAGGSYVNRNFEALLTKRLKHETYLETNGKILENIIKSKVIKFEEDKRKIDTTYIFPKVDIDYLQANSKRKFTRNKLEVSRYF